MQDATRVSPADALRFTDVTIVTGVAFLARVPWLHWPSAGGDGLEYLALASNLLTRASFSYDGLTPSCYRPPFYPAFLAAISALGMPPVQGAAVAQVLLGTATVALLYCVSASSFNRRAALAAALVMAVAPMSSRFVSSVLTETLFVFLIVAALWAWGRKRPALSGGAFGLACLTRAAALPFLVVIGVAALFTKGADRRQPLLRMIIAAAICIAPWTVRNVVECGHLSVADAGWGVNLLYGSVALRSGSNRWTQLLAQTSGIEGGAPTADAEARARTEAFARIRRNPVGWLHARVTQYPWLFLDTGDYLPIGANRTTFRRAIETHRPGAIALKLGFLVGNAALLVLALSGGYLVRHRATELAAVWTFPVFVAIAHLPMYVEPRYGLPLVPFEAIFAGVAISHFGAGRIGASASAKSYSAEAGLLARSVDSPWSGHPPRPADAGCPRNRLSPM